ncbi:ABC transporter ATP-binding protein [Bacillus freudenreichii]|nr:ABC transporter ATP-binding protein [Bacillus freudenreichii]
MNIWESFKVALSSIWNHKIRSILTMLGIIIGVAAVIVIVAIGQGAKKQMTDELFSTDKNVVELYFEPIQTEDEIDMFWQEPELASEDLEFLGSVQGVKSVLATNQGWGSLMINDKQGEMDTITGVDGEYFTARNIQTVEGRPLNDRDNDGLNRVVMIDTVARDKYFKASDDAVGEIIDLNGNPYKIVGVYESPIPEQFRWSENGEMVIPRSVVSMMFGNREIEQLAIIADDPERISEIGMGAAAALTEHKKLEDGQYSIHDFSEYEKEVETVITMMTLFIGSIAAISLLVGGIGVMNIMLVSVTERTREIGLRKALGATRGKILLQFLIESITLTSLGGLIGIGLAAVGALLVTMLSPITAVISPVVVLIGVGFSAFIGIVFGILPANKASKLSPIDALRYE